MSTPSPALAEAGDLLHDDLYAHLDEADHLATQEDEWSAHNSDTARKLIGDLVMIIRGLLIEHNTQQASGDCRTCASAWPCPVVTTIHAFLKDPQRQFIALVRRTRDEG